MVSEENELERALRRAASDPAYRPEFYAILLDSTVYVLGESDPAVSEGMIPAGARISIRSVTRGDGSRTIPFYASLAALQSATKDAAAKYLVLPTRSLFELTKGASLTLNLGLPQGKEFVPAEIEALLATGVNRVPQPRTLPENQTVLLGQPADYPDAMVAALKSFLSKRSEVKAAYLVLMQDQANNEKPVLVVGMESEGGDIESLFRDIGVVAGDTAPPGVPVDLAEIIPGEKGISEYCIGNVAPFYQRPPDLASGIRILPRSR